MKFLLDTNIVIPLLNGNTVIAEKIQHHSSELVVSSIVMFELYFGSENSQRRRSNLAKITTMPLKVIDFNESDGRVAGRIRNELKQKGTPIGVYDVLIAGQAVNRNLILVTNNVREFSRVDGLTWQDWLTTS